MNISILRATSKSGAEISTTKPVPQRVRVHRRSCRDECIARYAWGLLFFFQDGGASNDEPRGLPRAVPVLATCLIRSKFDHLRNGSRGVKIHPDGEMSGETTDWFRIMRALFTVLRVLLDTMWGITLDTLRPRSQLLAENARLRQQVIHLRRQVRRPRLSFVERALMVFFSRFISQWRHALHIVQPDILLRWHRDLFRTSYATSIADQITPAAHSSRCCRPHMT